MGVLLALFLSIYTTFYIVDRNAIVREAQSNGWSDVHVGYLYIFSSSGRMHFVTYTDKNGTIHKDQRCSMEFGKIRWKEE